MRFFTILAALPLALGASLLQVRQEDAVEGQYIVKLRDNADPSLVQTLRDQVENILPGRLGDTLDIGDFKGFVLANPNSNNLLDGLSNLPILGGLFNTLNRILDRVLQLDGVEYVEQVVNVRSQALVGQNNAPWGLARISNRNPYTSQYVFDNSAGAGTTAYIIDTGIYTSHNDFGGRASFGANFIDNQNTDCQGHGTHVAGTVGGNTYGVAKRANLVGVKVLDCNGDGNSRTVVAGIQYAAQQAQGNNRAVATLSLGGPFSRAINDAAAAAVRSGLFMAVASGNEGVNAENSSPASEPTVCTVGATDIYDRFASFSNFGSVVDILAPGVDILSAYIGSQSASTYLSGTSMATPHVAGLAAYLLALETPRAPVALCDRIKSLSTKNAVSGLGGRNTVNNLAYNGARG